VDLFPEDPLRRVLDEGIVWEDAFHGKVFHEDIQLRFIWVTYHESIEKGLDAPLADDGFFTKHAGYYVPTKDIMA